MNIEEMNTKINGLMKKYKWTMYGIVGCIAAYFIVMFVIKNQMLLLALCVPMILLGITNHKLGKQITQLVNERNEALKAQKAQEEQEQKTESGENESEDGAAAVESETVECRSLNDLPKEYTVMDKVDVRGQTVDHIIVSPYGVAIVNETDPTEDVREVIQTLNLEPPIFYYPADEDIPSLAAKIQKEKKAVLSEPEVYNILYRVSGLK